jgi:CBS domain-containing protein
VTDVARLMVQSQIHHVLVVEQDNVVGVVSALDLVAKYVIESEQPA